MGTNVGINDLMGQVSSDLLNSDFLYFISYTSPSKTYLWNLKFGKSLNFSKIESLSIAPKMNSSSVTRGLCGTLVAVHRYITKVY